MKNQHLTDVSLSFWTAAPKTVISTFIANIIVLFGTYHRGTINPLSTYMSPENVKVWNMHLFFPPRQEFISSPSILSIFSFCLSCRQKTIIAPLFSAEWFIRIFRAILMAGNEANVMASAAGCWKPSRTAVVIILDMTKWSFEGRTTWNTRVSIYLIV